MNPLPRRPPGMAPIDGGSFRIGSTNGYPEERPIRVVQVAPFWIDLHPVTNEAFARFVAATGYVTDAERRGASLVFTPRDGPVDLRDPRQWWTARPGASWHAPEGPGSTLDERGNHPVVHVSYGDAQAYCAWAGRRLPSETEWEYAARGGLDGATYAWGEEFEPGGRPMANTWQGEFPWQNLGRDGFAGTSPVGSFPPNGYGLYDMIGNVWEWTMDDADPQDSAGDASCCLGAPKAAGLKIVKGGSYLCAPNYCQRYRPAAKSAHATDSATGHIGFRCAMELTP